MMMMIIIIIIIIIGENIHWMLRSINMFTVLY
jgi:hypothetical protein